MPEGLPTVRIIDTNKPTPVEKSRAEKALLKESDSTVTNHSYPFKTIVPLLPNQITELVPKMIEKFIDGDLRHYYEQEHFGQWHRPDEHLVKEVNTKNFKQIILDDETVE